MPSLVFRSHVFKSLIYLISINLRRQRLVNAEWRPIRSVLGSPIPFGMKRTPQLHEKVETIHCHNTMLNIWRRGSDLNRRMEVLQTSPLGLLGTAPDARSITKLLSDCQLPTCQVNMHGSAETYSFGDGRMQGNRGRILP
jgi:hypothetical protein